MNADGALIDVDTRLAVAEALMRLSECVTWRPGRGTSHLAKRKSRRHIPQEMSFEEYNGLIRNQVAGAQGCVYSYTVSDTVYGVVLANSGGQPWLVIFGLDGVMETAFPPKRAEAYIAKNEMRCLGTVGEVVSGAD